MITKKISKIIVKIKENNIKKDNVNNVININKENNN